jgi:hypothetical protein
MRRLILGAGAAVLGLVTLAPAAQSATSLKCFGTESGSTCTPLKNGAFTLSNDAGEYSGVYVPDSGLNGKLYSSISKLQFNYSGDISGGSPRFTLPILAADGRDGWVFIDAASCNVADNSTSPSTGLVSPLVDPSCAVSGYLFNADSTTEGFYYTSWNAFMAGVGSGARFFSNNPFVIADQAGTVTVSNIQLATSGKK